MNKIVMFVLCLMLFSVGPVFSETYDSGEFTIPEAKSTRLQPVNLTFLGATASSYVQLGANTGWVISERDGILYDLEAYSSSYIAIGSYIVCSDLATASSSYASPSEILFAPLVADASSYRMTLMDEADGGFIPRTFRNGLNCWSNAIFEIITAVFREGS